MLAHVPEFEKRPGQMWPNLSARCYKCSAWSSNMPMSGGCLKKRKSGLICSHDLMPGDGCPDFEMRYPAPSS